MRPIVDIKSSNFSITNNVLGSGAFSIVKTAYIKDNGQTEIALKICHCNSEMEWLQSLNEVCLLKKLNHQNVVSLKKYEITKFHILIGLGKGDGTLKAIIKERSLNEIKAYVLSILSQLVSGLNFIHSLKIIHGDVKPDNILYIMQKNGILVQIMDFGLSHVAGIESSILGVKGGTELYMAPERLLNLNYDESSDLFSVGIVFFELLFKCHPFQEKKKYVETMQKKPKPRFPLENREVPIEWLDLISILLSYNPTIRNKVRNHEILQSQMAKKPSFDYYESAMTNMAMAENATRLKQYPEAIIFSMEASINFAMASSDINCANREELKKHSLVHRKMAFYFIQQFKYSYSRQDVAGENVHDEYYEYLMEVTKSTPTLKQYIEIGYTGELYLREQKLKMAFGYFIDALNFLNRAISSEPPGDRKTIIGQKMMQWTTMAEGINASTK